jgi:hypothetical protein
MACWTSLGMSEKVVVILGAGATVADSESDKVRPPLDRGFFSFARKRYPNYFKLVQEYIRRHYGADLCEHRLNSLEQVMTILYTDAYWSGLADSAVEAFRELVEGFNKILADTTNALRPKPRSCLHRLIAHFLSVGVKPEGITVLSFNQDLFAERVLARLAADEGQSQQSVFKFPGCYRMKFHKVISPANKSTKIELFDKSKEEESGVAVLKLHGSMNWYSTYDILEPSLDVLFDPNRSILVTRRMKILSGMRYSKAKYIFPIIVPPVVHKSGILHKKLRPVWERAGERVREADRVVIFGYSCPQNDWESANLLSGALNANKRAKERSIIDPDASVVLRYKPLGNLPSLSYYASADGYLAAE